MSGLRLSTVLRHMGACDDSLTWLAANERATFAEVWDACPRADWMLWLIAHSMPRETLVLCVCDIAETALVHVPSGEEQPRACIEVTRRWARGEATLDDVRKARQATYAAADAYAAAADAAAYATYAYAYAAAADAAAYAAAAAADAAAYAADAAAYAAAADAAAYAADAAAYAAYAAADAADDAARAQHCDIVRARVPAALIERAVYDLAVSRGWAVAS